MFYNWDLSDRLSCTPGERKECYKIVKQMIIFSKKARKQGLLSLEQDIPALESKFFQKALRLVVDGTNPGLIRHILRIQIYSRGYKGKKLLEHCIIYEGILAIQEGHNPRIVTELLHSFFPDDFRIEQVKQASEKYRKTLEELTRDASDFIYSEVEEILLDLEDRAIQKILREMDTYRLGIAMFYLADPVKHKILKNMSESGGILLLEDMNYTEKISEKQSKEEQDKLIRIMQKLEEQGEIIVRKPQL